MQLYPQPILLTFHKITIPTWLTISRIILTPIIIILLKINALNLAAVIFFLAILTDIADGWLARILHQQSWLGACLDPIADKFLIVSILFTLVYNHTSFCIIPAWFAWLVFCKELIQLLGAGIAYAYNGMIEIKPTFLGKTAMAAQSCLIIAIFASMFLTVDQQIINWLLYFTSIIIILALIQYGYQALIVNLFPKQTSRCKKYQIKISFVVSICKYAIEACLQIYRTIRAPKNILKKN